MQLVNVFDLFRFKHTFTSEILFIVIELFYNKFSWNSVFTLFSPSFGILDYNSFLLQVRLWFLFDVCVCDYSWMQLSQSKCDCSYFHVFSQSCFENNLQLCFIFLAVVQFSLILWIPSSCCMFSSIYCFYSKYLIVFSSFVSKVILLDQIFEWLTFFITFVFSRTNDTSEFIKFQFHFDFLSYFYIILLKFVIIEYFFLALY